jgi:hypothetical protein
MKRLPLKYVLSFCFFLLLSTCVTAQSLKAFRGATGKWGFKDASGKVVVPPKYDFPPGTFSEGIVIVKNGGLSGTGFVDASGREIAPPGYTTAYPFTNGVALACKGGRDIYGTGGKWGVIDKNGKEVIPFIYDRISGNFEGDSYVIAQQGSQSVMLDKTGKRVTFPDFDQVPGNFLKTPYSPASKGGKWGLIDKKGKVVIPIEHEGVQWESEGLVPVKKDGKWGYMDLKGQWKIDPQFEYAPRFEKGFAVPKMNGKYGCINRQGKITIPFEYDYAYPTLTNMPLVKLQKKGENYSSLTGLANPLTGKILAPVKYESIYDFGDGIAQVKVKNKFGFIDSTGKEIVQPVYDYTPINFSEGLSYVQQNGKYGFVDRTGKLVVPLVYDFAANFSEGVAAVKQNGLGGYIDKKGGVAIPLRFKTAGDFQGGVAMVVDAGGRTFYIDKTGNEVK